MSGVRSLIKLVKDLPEIFLIELKILMCPGVGLLIMLVDDLPGLIYMELIM